MGYCKDCGSVCLDCRARTDDYTLLSLNDSIRNRIDAFLTKINANQNDQDWLCRMLVQYPATTVEHALRSWENTSWSEQQMNVRYFYGVIKRLAAAPKMKLSTLPPYAGGPDGEHDK